TGHFTAWSETGNLTYAPNLATPVTILADMADEATLVPRYRGTRTGPNTLDKSTATPTSTGVVFAPLVDDQPPIDLAVGATSLEDFFGRLRRNTPVSGAVEAGLPFTIETEPDGNILVVGLSAGDVTVDISGSGAHDGATLTSVNQRPVDPIFVSQPTFTGVAAEGNLLTAQSAAIWFDDTYGQPLTEWFWIRSGIVVEEGPTRTVTAADVAQGLALQQTVTTGQSLLNREISVLEVQPFQEQMVRTIGGQLASPSVIGTGSETEILFFAKVELPDFTSADSLIASPDGTWDGPLVASQTSGAIFTSSMSRQATFHNFLNPPHSFVPGDKVTIMVSTNVNGTAQYRLRDVNGVWQGTDQTINSTVAQGRVLIASNNLNFPWTTGLVRMAVWIGAAPDLDDPDILAHFVEPTSGDLVNPAVSQSIYGTPVFDFYGDAATWNAGQHQGSLPNFIHTGELFVDVP
ncbi:MAG: hypothetical protein AAFU56_00465, partial [Pseudomonadota bacterium]